MTTYLKQTNPVSGFCLISAQDWGLYYHIWYCLVKRGLVFPEQCQNYFAVCGHPCNESDFNGKVFHKVKHQVVLNLSILFLNLIL